MHPDKVAFLGHFPRINQPDRKQEADMKINITELLDYETIFDVIGDIIGLDKLTEFFDNNPDVDDKKLANLFEKKCTPATAKIRYFFNLGLNLALCFDFIVGRTSYSDGDEYPNHFAYFKMADKKQNKVFNIKYDERTLPPNISFYSEMLDSLADKEFFKILDKETDGILDDPRMLDKDKKIFKKILDKEPDSFGDPKMLDKEKKILKKILGKEETEFKKTAFYKLLSKKADRLCVDICQTFKSFNVKNNESFLCISKCCAAYANILSIKKVLDEFPKNKDRDNSNKELINYERLQEAFLNGIAFEIIGKANKLLGYWDINLSEKIRKREGSFKSPQSKEKADNIKITEKILDNPKYKHIKKPWDHLAVRLEVQQSTGKGERPCIDYIKAASENKKRDFDARP